MKNVLKTKTLDSTKFGLYNKETGEILPDEIGTLTVSEKTNLYTLTYKNFVYLDTDKVKYFSKKGLKLHHLGLLSFLSTTAKFTTNACLDETGEPLSTKKIAFLIDKSENATKALMNELESFGLVWYGRFPEYKRKVYVLNPHIIRMGKQFSKFTVSNFFELGIDPSDQKAEDLKNIMEKGEPSPQ